MDGVQDPGTFHATQQVVPALVEAGRGTIVRTGTSVSLRGEARFSPLAVGKFGLRVLGQIHTQDPTAWTLEPDLRPSVERS
jgi:hypothetical protein